MFRRAASFPARPSIPNKDEILEDLTSASPDDVIFEYSEKNLANAETRNSLELYEEEYVNGEFGEEKAASASYLKIDSFLDKINSLKNNLSKLKEQKNSLKILEENLLQDMNRLKNELSADSQASLKN